MESLNEQEAMRVLKAAGGAGRAALDGVAALGEDVWREMTEMEGGEQKRHGDLDSWLDVFRATAGTAAAAAGAAAVAAPAAAPAAATAAEEGPASATAVEGGGEAGGAAAATAAAQDATAEGGEDGGAAATSGEEAQQLMGLLGLQPADVLACRLEPSGECPGFFLAVHHESRTVRLVIRGASSLPDLLKPGGGGWRRERAGVRCVARLADVIDWPTNGWWAGRYRFGHRGMLAAAQQLLGEAGGRMRAAMAAHPGYGLRCIGHSEGAGIAALLAVLLLSPEGGPGGGQPAEEMLGGGPGPGPGPGPEGEWRVRVRATCFGPPPVLTSELAERTAGCIDSVVYNADLWSRCSSASLRRLTGEMSAASQEVLARSELAQTLRRSGALGLANHLVAAALCRCQPPQDSPAGPLAPAPAPGPAAMLMGVPSRPHLAVPEGLAAPRQQPHQTTARGGDDDDDDGGGGGGGTAGGGADAGAYGTTDVGVAAASPLPMPPPPLAPLPPPAAPPAPLGPPTGTLPPLPAAVSSGAALGVGGAAAAAAARASGFESPHRRPPEAQGGPVGVLSPPPLVAAAAAAQHAAAGTVAAVVTAGRAAAAAAGPRQLRHRGQGRVRGTVVQRRRQRDAGRHPRRRRHAGGGGRAAAGTAGGAAAAAASRRAPRRSAAAAAAAAGAAYARRPRRPTTIRSVNARPDGAFRGAGGVFSAAAAALVPQPESGSERSMRGIQLLQLSDGSFTKHPQQQQQLQLPLPVPQLQQQPQQQAGQELERAWAEEGPELHVPGVVHLIERRGANANASFRLLRDVNRAHLARVLLKRSMLRDHLLSHYTAALERTMVQR
ncbi:hypothetical protein PLESTM_000868000 [Pleodorina starrii]|nr:hypothetical protein PLESTM_000868000 [Pleodorina starrii]